MFAVCYIAGLKHLVHVRVIHHTCTKQLFEGHEISFTKTFVRNTYGNLILLLVQKRLAALERNELKSSNIFYF